MVTHHETDALQFLVAALQAVVPELEGLHDVNVNESRLRLSEVRSGPQLWDACLSDQPGLGTLVAGLTDGEREMVRQVLDGMLRERWGP